MPGVAEQRQRAAERRPAASSTTKNAATSAKETRSRHRWVAPGVPVAVARAHAPPPSRAGRRAGCRAVAVAVTPGCRADRPADGPLGRRYPSRVRPGTRVRTRHTVPSCPAPIPPPATRHRRAPGARRPRRRRARRHPRRSGARPKRHRQRRRIDLQNRCATEPSAAGLDVDAWKLDLGALRADPDCPGTEVDRLEGYGVVGTSRGEGPPALVLQGHVDVVPPGDPAKWPAGDPCGARIDGDTLHGRGACDMKAGVVGTYCRLAPSRDPVSELGVRACTVW